MDRRTYENYISDSEPSVPIRTIGRIDAIKAADILGFEQHDIPILIQNKLLRPLAQPLPNARKYFAAVDILKLAASPKWLSDATDTLYKHWQTKNANRTKEESAVASN